MSIDFHKLVDTTLRGATYIDIAHEEALREHAKRECKAIDALYTNKRRGANGSGAERRDKTKLAPPTLHDLATTNEFVRALLRKAQDSGLIKY